MITFLVWLAIYIGAIGLAAILVTFVACVVHWTRESKKQQHKASAAAAYMGQWMREQETREKYATAISTARMERHFVVPIDAENDAEAVDAITVYAIRLAEQWEKEGRAA